MNDLRNERGVITVFLCIILIAFLMLVCVVVDTIRIQIAKKQIESASDIVMNSVMAGYESELKKDYDLFGVYFDQQKIQETFKNELQKNLNSECYVVTNKKIKIPLYSYNIEDITITPVYDLCDNEILERQMIDTIKYTAPKEIIDFIGKLTLLNTASKNCNIYENKIQEDRLASDVEEKDGQIISQNKIDGNTNVEESEEIKKLKKLDTRKKTSEEAKSLINENKKQDIKIEDDLYKQLPSQIKSAIKNEIKDTKKIEFDAKKDRGYSEESLNFVSKFFVQSTSDITDQAYEDEYILKYFKNYLNSSNQKDKNTYFENEIEYILNGDKSQNENVKSIKSKLLMTRFASNVMYLYKSNDKRELALATATAVAGWWTAGSEIPIMQNMILCGWAMEESILDIKDLFNGKTVPLYKTDINFKLQIGNLVKNKSLQSNEKQIDFSYEDYLRLFLLFQNKETKIKRVQDLIQLNLQKYNRQYLLFDTNTQLKVDIKASIKYMFMTKGFMKPLDKVENTNRHYINITLTRGY